MKRRKDETSYKETAFGIIPRRKLIPLEIEGIKRAWDFILKKRKSGLLPLTSAFMQKIHQVGFGWIFPKMGGKWRAIEVSVSEHKPPACYLVPQLMKDFTEDLKIRLRHLSPLSHPDFLKNLTEILAWAHHRFLWIHPFTDYNGRIGRLLISMIMLNLSLPPIELKAETKAGRKKYVKALREADHEDCGSLEKLMFGAIREAAKNI